MKLFSLLLLSILVVASFFFYQNQNLKPKSNSLITENLSLPKFTMLSLKNTEVNSSELKRNKKFFVHIWGTWCGPCQTEFPVFLKYAEQAQNKNINFYLIATNDDLKSVVKFLNQYPNLPNNVEVYLDVKNEMTRLLKSNQVPETFLFDESGNQINKFVGPQNWGQKYYQDII